MSTIYLPIRAFGDFTISASVAKNSSGEKIPILLPEYLAQLFNALECAQFFEVVDTLPLPIYHKLFQLRKVKGINDLRTMYRDIQTIKNHLDKKANYVVDYKNKRSKPFGGNFFAPVVIDNIYTAKGLLFEQYFNVQTNFWQAFNKQKTIKTVAFFPGSRFLVKAVPDALVSAIASKLTSHGLVVNIMYHESETTSLKQAAFFSNFMELKKAIEDADYVISADSLPVHIAYYFDKPHFAVYNKEPNSVWATPFTRHNNFFATYDNTNAELIMQKISQCLVM